MTELEEKKINQYILILADDINEALKNLEKGLSNMLVPYVATSVQLSTIADVFPYDDIELQDKIVERKPAVESEVDYPETEALADETGDENSDE